MKKKLIAALIVLVLIGYLVWAKQQVGQSEEAPSYKPPTGYAYGSVNGVPIRIPRDELFILDYGNPDGSELSSDTPRDCHAPIQSAVMFLRWPGLEPRTTANYRDFIETQWESVGNTQWLDFGFGNAGTRPARLKDGSNYLWQRRLGRLYLHEIGGDLPAGMEFKYYEHDSVTGLPYAVPVGPKSTERDHTWNNRVYWNGLDKSTKTVTTLITCSAGQFAPPQWTPTCRHDFHIPQTQMDVSVTYTENLLPEWREIESSVREHFLNYIYSCPTNAGSNS